MPKVSIISTCYNEELNIIECYETVKKQFQNLDKTATKIKKLLNHIKKIQYAKLFMLKFSWFLNKLKKIPATIK